MLAARLVPKYRYENCAVIALSTGGVVVGAQIAMELHCPINLLLTEDITLPRELSSIATIAQDGSFSYNKAFGESEISELTSEYFQFIEQQKMDKLNRMHRLLGLGGTIRKDLLRGRYIILVSDGLKQGHNLDIIVEYLKPIASEGIVIATPLASVDAVDYMHVLADDLYCLSVVDNYMDTPHYYDQQDIPDDAKVVEIIEKIILNWK